MLPPSNLQISSLANNPHNNKSLPSLLPFPSTIHLPPSHPSQPNTPTLQLKIHISNPDSKAMEWYTTTNPHSITSSPTQAHPSSQPQHSQHNQRNLKMHKCITTRIEGFIIPILRERRSSRVRIHIFLSRILSFLSRKRKYMKNQDRGSGKRV